MAKEFKSTSGKKVVINPADTDAFFDLKDKIQKAAADSGIEIKGASDIMDTDVASLVKVVFQVDSDKSVRDALFAALTRSTRDGQKITKDTFDDVDARQDYYEIMKACVEVNYVPFFAPLRSLFAELVTSVFAQVRDESPNTPESK